MAKLTGMRRVRPGHLLLEVDGRPWRTVSDDVAVACGLHSGLELDRPRLRQLRRELRRAQALLAAGRFLARRDVSTRRLGERLSRAGLPPSTVEGTVVRLVELGIVDDRRLAARRAAALAARGWGDAAIAAHLEREAIAGDEARAALAELVPEAERARALADGERSRGRAAALLARRGFSADAIEHALARRGDETGDAA